MWPLFGALTRHESCKRHFPKLPVAINWSAIEALPADSDSDDDEDKVRQPHRLPRWRPKVLAQPTATTASSNLLPVPTPTRLALRPSTESAEARIGIYESGIGMSLPAELAVKEANAPAQTAEACITDHELQIDHAKPKATTASLIRSPLSPIQSPTCSASANVHWASRFDRRTACDRPKTDLITRRERKAYTDRHVAAGWTCFDRCTE
mmetsp:Transcript_52566/g.87232  ORF Transcript_52566/g.87232 Transcript_52566/m.87232 type:complete len:209 (+) Transcript_52566:67-693(+)